MRIKDTLLRMMEGTSPETGEDFFAALVKNLSQSLDMAAAWVTEYVADFRELQTLAFWIDGRWIENMDMDGLVQGTPCEAVISKGEVLFVADEVAGDFPDDPDLVKLGMSSYIGIPFKDNTRQVFGHLAVMDREPVHDKQAALSLMRIFASRAGAELRRIRAEERLRQREEKLARLLDTAPDAIVEVDAALNILLMNTAARKAYGLQGANDEGCSLSSYLSEASLQHLTEVIGKLEASQSPASPVWVPEVLTAVCNDGSSFPAEATLSRTDADGASSYILILRNINDRLEAEEKIQALGRETKRLRAEIRSLSNVEDIIGTSLPLMRVLKEVDQVAATDATVLIIGETGTGKELIARAIHGNSHRRDNPMIRVNCAAIPEGLIESEFFGHERGAFTGATQKREGRFAMADHGTIFLDEVAELTLDLQAKLLRVLQEGEFEPVGSGKTRKVDVRVIAATHRDLKSEVTAGRFREDLYFRLSVFPLELPPLRKRGDDVLLLSAAFTEKAARRMGRKIDPLSPADRERLKRYEWPGNVRELQNVIERAVITATGDRLNLDRALPETASHKKRDDQPADESRLSGILTAEQFQALERDNLLRAMTASGWRVSGKDGAARLLGIPPSTLNSRLKALGLKRPSVVRNS
ncbi:MAG: sigma 54-interacting transcriptional regulator [Desulfobacteraceae bacterium]